MQAPDNRTIAIFSVEKLENNPNYQTHLLDRSQIPQKRMLVYHGADKQKAIEAAQGAARYFARTLDANFEDNTEI